jgi:hypothetical protein
MKFDVCNQKKFLTRTLPYIGTTKESQAIVLCKEMPVIPVNNVVGKKIINCRKVSE